MSREQELESLVAVLQHENEVLTEAQQSLLMLRAVADSDHEASSVTDIIEATLETIGILWDLPLCLCFQAHDSGPHCIASYSPRTNETPLLSAVRADSRLLGIAEKEFIGCSLDEARELGVLVEPLPDFEPSVLFLYRFTSLILNGPVLVLAANPHKPAARTELELSLREAAKLVELRIEGAYNLSQLRDQNRELATRVEARTSELRASEVLYRNVFEQAATGVVYVGFGDIIERVNQRFVEMLGYASKEEVEGRSFMELTHGDDRAKGKQAVEDLWTGKLPHFTQEKRYLQSDGRVLWGRTLVSLISDEEGKPVHAVAIVIDITEHKQAEMTLSQMTKLESIGQLAGGIAHDFNNLLSPILGLSELLIDDLPEGPEREDVECILDAGQRARDLARKLLAFGRRQTAERRSLHIGETVDDLISLLQRTLRPSIQLVADTSKTQRTVFADRSQIEQVVMNMAVNAQDAMPNGGRLEICVEDLQVTGPDSLGTPTEVPAGAYVRLSVLDDGTGMSSDTLRQMFEPFFSTKDVDKGTGLGLASAYGIIRQLEGYIWAQSELGIGSRFFVLLPQELNHESKPTVSEPVSVRHAPARIAVIDDDDLVRRVVGRVLQKHRHEVQEYPGALAFLEDLEQTSVAPFDLVLCDVMMPEMDGWALAKRLDTLAPNLPVLMLSGYSPNAETHMESVKCVIGVMPKPVDTARLLHRIAIELERRGDTHGSGTKR